MTLENINAVACGLIALWATWCVLSGKVRDGIVGKLIYSAIAICGFAVMTRNQSVFFGPSVAGLSLHVALAMAGIRHMFMVTYWPRVKAYLCRYLHCQHCLNEKGAGNDNQR
jgi:hypothetical protein